MNQLLKKLIAGISALAMCISVMPLTASAVNTDYTQGDINGDGVVNSVDVLVLNKFLRGSVAAKDGAMAERFDVNKDGVIDRNDVNIIRSINLGFTDTVKILLICL